MWLHFVHQLVHERTHLFAVYIILTHTFFHPLKYYLTNGSTRRLNLLQLLITLKTSLLNDCFFNSHFQSRDRLFRPFSSSENH